MSTQGLTLDALKRRQTFLKMLLFFFVTVIAWLFFSVLHEQSAIPPDDEVKRMAEPLNPNLNLEVIHELEQKKTFSKAELDSVRTPPRHSRQQHLNLKHPHRASLRKHRQYSKEK
jgi:hypothetical protein